MRWNGKRIVWWCHRNPNIAKNFERNSHWRKLSMIMVWERYCNASPKPEFFLFSLFIFSFISQLIRVRLGWNFHRWFSIQKQVNWCPIDPFSLKFCTSQHSYPAPLIFLVFYGSGMDRSPGNLHVFMETWWCKYYSNNHLWTVLAMFSTSLSEGGYVAPPGNTRLMGSKRRDKDRDRYAVSNGNRDSFSALSGLQ